MIARFSLLTSPECIFSFCSCESWGELKYIECKSRYGKFLSFSFPSSLVFAKKSVFDPREKKNYLCLSLSLSLSLSISVKQGNHSFINGHRQSEDKSTAAHQKLKISLVVVVVKLGIRKISRLLSHSWKSKINRTISKLFPNLTQDYSLVYNIIIIIVFILFEIAVDCIVSGKYLAYGNPCSAFSIFQGS